MPIANAAVKVQQNNVRFPTTPAGGVFGGGHNSAGTVTAAQIRGYAASVQVSAPQWMRDIVATV